MKPLTYALRDVRKVYDGRCVLSISSLDIAPGEIFGLIGPSGAGKSTLLRLLNFVERPTSGAIHYKGYTSANGNEPPLELRRKITMVFQKPLLLNRSVHANVAFGLRVRGQNHLQERVSHALELVSMTAFEHTAAGTLSGGEAQRVALARALAFQPDTILLDEPTANLDPFNIHLIEDVLMKFKRENNASIVFVTHNIFQARRIADRVGLLLNGSLIEVGDRDPFFNQPNDPRTAEFIAGDIIY